MLNAGKNVWPWTLTFLRRIGGRLPLMLLVLFVWLPVSVEAQTTSDQTGSNPAPAPAPAAARQTLTDAEVHFRGNETLSARVLREAAAYELDRFREMGFRRADIDDAAYRIELAYRERGYAFAEVDYLYETVENRAIATFLISEGPRVRIDAIRFVDNQAFSDNQLDAFFQENGNGLLATGSDYFVRSQLDDALSGIRDLYYSQGYLDARIQEPRIEFSADRRRAEITIAISEGAQYLIREVRFEGDVYPETRGPLADARGQMVGKPYNQRQNLELSSNITEIYGNLGYPDVRVDVSQKQLEEPSQVLLEAQIDSGPRIRISEIVISGNRDTRASFIRSRLAVEPGEYYSIADQRQSFRRLYQSRLFSRVNLFLAPGPDEEHRILHVEVEELLSRELSVEAGWGSYELLRARLGYLDRNPFGTGRLFRTEFGGSYRGANLMASILDPWFLRTDITAHLPIFINYREEPSFTRREIGSSLLFTRELTRDLAISLAYTFRNTVLTNIDVDVPQDDSRENYNLGSIKSQISHNTRNDIFYPTSGQESYLAGEIAASALGSEISFYRITAGVNRYFSLRRATVLALRYDTGFTIPRQETLPLGERFFTGGESTVRSFRQDQVGPSDATGEPIGGLAFNVVSAEIRQQLRGPLIGTLFVDYGNVAPNSENLFGTSRSELLSATFSEYFRDMRPSIGFGLQYLLPIGPIRLDTAFNPAAREGERDYTIHFSVGMAF
jgi:outer membrane protein insertion porin family